MQNSGDMDSKTAVIHVPVELHAHLKNVALSREMKLQGLIRRILQEFADHNPADVKTATKENSTKEQ